MFGGIKNKFKKTKEEFKEGVETRKQFGSEVWANFRRFTDWKGLKFDRAEYTFEEIQQKWGFGTGTGGYIRGKQNNMFMCIFFYLIFAWCAFYFVKSAFFMHNYISAVSCVIGMTVGVVTGTVSLWRWMVFKNRKYVPFLKWLCGKN